MAWWEVMAWLPFEVDPRDGVPPEEVRYGVGNPMGFYTSWAAFALCHHAVLRMLGRRVLPKCRWKDLPYVLLGDDILIYHDGLAAAYKEFLQTVGVE